MFLTCWYIGGYDNENLKYEKIAKLIYFEYSRYTKQLEKIEYNEEIIYMFNNNYLNFIDGTIKSRYIEGDEHIFYKIRHLNNNTSIVPDNDDIKKLKFNEEILDELFINKKLDILEDDKNNAFH